MDIAGMVGFAASGPVDVPVAVESALRFRQVFGPDLPLARDPTTGQPHRGYLGQAVEAFFRNGGRRCWVVRVADQPTAGRFAIPGLVLVSGGRGSWRLGEVRARSGGSWSDGLGVAGVLGSQALTTPPPAEGQPPALDVDRRRLRVAAPADLAPGDLLQVRAPGRDGPLVLAVATVTAAPGHRVVGWEPAGAVWLVGADAATGRTPAPTATHRLTADGPQPVRLRVTPAAGAGLGGPAYTVEGPDADTLAPGDVLRVDHGAASLLLPVPAQPPAERRSQAGAGPLLAGPGWFLHPGAAGTPAGWWSQQPTPPLVVERLTLDLTVWREETLEARLDGLGLTGRHPRSWQGLPGDERLFRMLADLPGEDGPRQPSGVPARARFPSELWREAFSPRFPLATEPAGPDDGEAALWLPLGVPAVPDPAAARTGLGDTEAASRLRRDGLKDFSAALFLDPSLQHLTSREVLRVAENRAFLSRPPRELRGLHGLFPIEEVTLAAVPDATHPGWTRTVLPRPAPLDAPALTCERTGPDAVALSWTEVDGATGYLLEQADEPTFERPLARRHGPEPAALLEGFGDCPATRAFRVRAARGGLAGPWSNTCQVVLPAGDFEDCVAPLAAPELRLAPGDPPGGLTWTPVGVDAYQVEVSPSPAFLSAEETLAVGGSASSLAVDLPAESARYLRIRGRRGQRPGPWSNTVIWDPPAPPEAVVRPAGVGPRTVLLEVHRSLLRLCAARGDVLAVLALAPGDGEEQALDHVARLLPAAPGPAAATTAATSPVPPLGAGEEAALSFAALYHPWVAIRVDGADGPEIVTLPPDGAACGRIAKRARTRGAWIAPANETLEQVLALDPVLQLDAQARLLAGGVNLIRADPQGFVVAGADTLSLDRGLRPIGARRLLVLLRRLALREGLGYVFLPHDRAFRNGVVTKLDTLLADLYRRGAFAGRRPAEAYRVVGDDSNNPPFSVDQGRFVVDLLVAPSEPMRFIRVRLVQTGPASVVAEEVAGG
jgi:hypothetical protein